MPLSLACPSCRSKLKAPDAALGKTLQCPRCGAPVLVTGLPAVPPTPRIEDAPKAAVTPAPPPQEPILNLPEDLLPAANQQIEEIPEVEEPDYEIVEEDEIEEVEEVEEVEDEEVLDALPARVGLLDRDRVIIKGLSGGWSNAFKKTLEYHLLDPKTRKRIGIGREAPGSGVDALQVLFGKGMFPTQLEVWERNERDLVFWMRRPPRIIGIGAVLKVEVFDHRDRPVGTLQAKGFFTQQMNMNVLDAGGELIGDVKMPFFTSGYTLTFRSKNGKELGSASAAGKLVEQRGIRWFPRGSVWAVSAGKAIADSPALKTLLLAAPLAWDLGFYDYVHTRGGLGGVIG
jgi:hypothetical protein